MATGAGTGEGVGGGGVAVGAAGVLLGVDPGAAIGRDVVVGVGIGVSVPMGGCALGTGSGVAVGAGVSVPMGGCALGAGSGVAVGAGVSVPMGGCALGILAVEGDAKTALGAAAIRQATRKPIPIAAMARIQVFSVFKYILYSLWPLTRRPEHSQHIHDEPYYQPKNGQHERRKQDKGGR